MTLARNFLRLLALLCCAFSLSAPASARQLHMVDHVSSPVAAGQAHDHDHDDGDVLAEVAVPDSPPPGDEVPKKSGHSHPPGSVFDLSHLPDPVIAERHLARDDGRVAAKPRSLTTRAWSPPVRPPRTA